MFNAFAHIRTFFRRLSSHFHDRANPSRIIALGFVSLIFIGAVLLSLPFASPPQREVGFSDALFAATSAVCVTGLTTGVFLNQWTAFGQIVIIILVQIGGLGFMTALTLAMMLMGKQITLKDRLAIRASFNQSSLQGMVIMVRKVLIGTLLLEGIAAVILTLRFWADPGTSFPTALWRGIFHAISAFCCAGYDIIGSTSLSAYVGDPIINIVITSLIIIGGIGFSVWFDVTNSFRLARQKKDYRIRYLFLRLSLHSKIALSITAFLLVFGTLFFLQAEWNNPNTLNSLPPSSRVMAAYFQSVTTRTSGFYTIPQEKMTIASQFLTLLYMLIGGSPGGTAGGIKTVTIGIIFISVFSLLRGRDSMVAFGRTIPYPSLTKALTVVIMFFLVIFTATLALSVTERDLPSHLGFDDILFETVSATATTGLSSGLTPHLSSPGRLIIAACMFVGRLGPLTVVLALSAQLQRKGNAVKYPQENLFIG